jgi:hypothetical protein
MRKGMEIDLQNGLHVRMCVESQEKKNYEACLLLLLLLLRRVLQPLNFLDAQNLITHAFIFPKEKPQTATETPKKKQMIFKK